MVVLIGLFMACTEQKANIETDFFATINLLYAEDNSGLNYQLTDMGYKLEKDDENILFYSKGELMLLIDKTSKREAAISINPQANIKLSASFFEHLEELHKAKKIYYCAGSAQKTIYSTTSNFLEKNDLKLRP